MPSQSNSPGGEDRLLSASEVCHRLAISRRTLSRLVAAARLPRPIKVSPRLVRFRASEIERLINKPASY
jgi:excisionase family DNA binding protein